MSKCMSARSGILCTVPTSKMVAEEYLDYEARSFLANINVGTKLIHDQTPTELLSLVMCMHSRIISSVRCEG